MFISFTFSKSFLFRVADSVIWFANPILMISKSCMFNPFGLYAESNCLKRVYDLGVGYKMVNAVSKSSITFRASSKDNAGFGALVTMAKNSEIFLRSCIIRDGD